jgi:alkane 1-monooxygenase
MHKRVTSYLQVFIVPIGALISYFSPGIFSFWLPFMVFVLMPVLDTKGRKSQRNYDAEGEKAALADKFYDMVLYIIVPVHYMTIFIGLYVLIHAGYQWESYEVFGKVFALGCTCGIIGINVGHELGHRPKRFDRNMAKASLLTSLYMHFIIEHNLGHHKKVATDDDPASSRKGEILYIFWFRSMIMGYFSAWKLEAARLKRMSHGFISHHNQMLWFTLIQFLFVGFMYVLFGFTGMKYFLIGALVGGLLLEAVNYIEHYGLRRNKKEGANNYERVMPIHSWNSNHKVGRIQLLEVTRHSDHHYLARRKYQILRHFDESPQLPFGYPLAILVSMVPPLWFYIMDKELEKYKERLKDPENE